MCHQAHLTPSTSWPNPTYGPDGPPGPILPPLTGEEGTGDGCVLQQLTHPGQGAGVCDGAAHLRIHELNELLNMLVALLVPSNEDPRQGGGGQSLPGPSPPCMGGYLASAEGRERREGEVGVRWHLTMVQMHLKLDLGLCGGGQGGQGAL